jgi:hypothetical protein
MTHRAQQRIDLHYRLASLGGVTPTTQEKTWFFDLPAQRDTDDNWRELLHRIFYDANVGMHLREPGDENWLALDHWIVTPVDVQTMLAWDGQATKENAKIHLPWVLAHFAVVWESSACYFINDAGAYDGMTGYDFSELLLFQALNDGKADEPTGRAFMQHLYPKGDSQGSFNDRAARLKNITCVRPSTTFRKPPGEQPWVSGPVYKTTQALSGQA